MESLIIKLVKILLLNNYYRVKTGKNFAGFTETIFVKDKRSVRTENYLMAGHQF